MLQRFNVFSMGERPQSNVLQNIATKDVVTDDIQASLLSAEQIGQEKLNEFVEKRLMKQSGETAREKNSTITQK